MASNKTLDVVRVAILLRDELPVPAWMQQHAYGYALVQVFVRAVESDLPDSALLAIAHEWVAELDAPEAVTTGELNQAIQEGRRQRSAILRSQTF